MPKIAIDYSKTIIYKICCKDTNIKDLYVGSTTNFVKRKQSHKSSCNNVNDKKYSLYVYTFIRENGGFENWEMVMIEECVFSNKMEALKQERYWLEELGATLNKTIPSRTIEEYRDENKDKMKGYMKEYVEANKEIINDKKKKYYQTNRDKILSKTKEYRKANKENITDKKKKYYQTNRDKLLIKMKEYKEANQNRIIQYHKQYYELNKKNNLEILGGV